MWNFLYKLDSFFSRIKYKLDKNNKITKILNNKIIYIIMWLLFIIFLISFLYDFYEHRWTYKFIKKHIYRIRDIDLYFIYWLVTTSIYWIYVFKSNIIKFLKKFFNLFVLNIVIYTGLVFLFTTELKTQVLAIVTPIVIYFIYKIYNHINDTKEKYTLKFLFDSRYLFLIALVLLVYTPIYIYLEDKKTAETLSIYAYYFLVVWVIYEIIISKFQKN